MAKLEHTLPEKADILDAGDKHELKVQELKNKQFKRLQNEAQAIFRTVQGLPGISTPQQWDELLEKTGCNIKNGQFLLERLGAKRYLDPELMAALALMRGQLLSEIENPTASDMMLADTAIIAYRHMLRLQGWMDSICLVVERDLFGQAPLNEMHGFTIGDKLEKQIGSLENQILPLMHKNQKMLMSALNQLNTRQGRPAGNTVSVNRAQQVNVGSAIINN
jgi:hypothetical protein